MPPPTLVTWDIDGTLLSARGPSGNAAHKRAIDDAVAATFGISVHVNQVPHAGATDRAIIRDMCLLRGIAPAEIAASTPAAISRADALIGKYAEKDLRHLVLPGVPQVLAHLKEAGVKLALTTGNLESCAWVKVRAAGLGEFFGGGGFGSDCLERTDILKLAMERVGTGGGAVYHVGDAVADMVAARENGVGGIGVLTGSFTRAQLEREGAVAVLDDLGDTQRFLRVVGMNEG